MLPYLILFFFFRLCWSASVHVVDSDNPVVVINAEDPWDGPQGAVINGSFYQTVKSYYCRSASTPNQELIVYGSSAWTFPLQDVNLTLQYPPKNANNQPSQEYMLTELRVMLYMEGSSSRAYITRGGLYQNNISISFIVSSVSRLAYYFWVYGVPAPPTVTESYNTMYHGIC